MDLVIIIPGITGTVLRSSDGRVIWGQSAGTVARSALNPWSTIAQLALPEGLGDDAPEAPHRLSPDGLMRGWHVFPGLHTGNGYAQLVRLARRVGGGPCIFAYDWRLSNRYSAQLLARCTEKWLDDWRHSSGDSQAMVTFVCHSMGGLIARYYLEVLGGRSLARRLITLGTPYSGSIKTIRALTGDAFARVPFLGDRITEAARSFPSLAQLLPTYRCVQSACEPLRLSEHELPGLATRHIADGAAFHAEISSAAKRNGPASYDVYPLIGRRNETLQSVSVSGGEVRYHRRQRGEDHGGDGTVPTFAAVPPEWTDTSGAEVFAARHASLAATENVMEAVWNKLSPVSLGDTLHPTVELGVGLTDIARRGEPIVITAQSNREDVLLQATLADLGTGAVIMQRLLAADGDGRYSTTVSLPVPGPILATVSAIAEVPPVQVHDVLYVVNDHD